MAEDPQVPIHLTSIITQQTSFFMPLIVIIIIILKLCEKCVRRLEFVSLQVRRRRLSEFTFFLFYLLSRKIRNDKRQTINDKRQTNSKQTMRYRSYELFFSNFSIKKILFFRFFFVSGGRGMIYDVIINCPVDYLESC